MFFIIAETLKEMLPSVKPFINNIWASYQMSSKLAKITPFYDIEDGYSLIFNTRRTRCFGINFITNFERKFIVY